MKDLLLAIFNIFKGLAKVLSLTSILFFNLLFIAVVAVIIFSFFRSTETVIPSNSVLQLTISGDIVEQRRTSDPIEGYFSGILGLPEDPRETVLQDILDAVDQARDDDHIKALLLDLKPMGYAGLNQLQSIGAALSRFKAGGKPVIAAEDYYSQDQYYLAAHADTIFLNPMGGVNLNGFGSYRYYFQEALQKLKINFHVFQVGSYKSATEPLTRTSMSPEDRSQSREWLNALWHNYSTDVAAQRQLTPDAINAYINRIPDNLREAGGDTARLALHSGLVDELQPRHEINRYLRQLTGPQRDDADSRLVPLRTYLKTVSPSLQEQSDGQDLIGLIVAAGSIMPGQSNPGTIGADSMIALLKQARTTPSIKAVVLRIDSGGGSAFASELIRQEILQLQLSGKPVLVSMGTVAASGAYWISANADEIWGAPSTITGSIGIFMALPTFENALAAAGIRRDGVGTANLAAGLDLSQPLAPEVKQAIQLTLENGYHTFLSIVAEGRGLNQDSVERLAQGRVYAGSAALELGLIDKLGELDDVIRAAGARANLTDYAVTTLSEPLSLRERLFQRIGSEALIRLQHHLPAGFAELLAAAGPEMRNLRLFNDPQGIYAHCMLPLF